MHEGAGFGPPLPVPKGKKTVKNLRKLVQDMRFLWRFRNQIVLILVACIEMKREIDKVPHDDLQAVITLAPDFFKAASRLCFLVIDPE